MVAPQRLEHGIPGLIGPGGIVGVLPATFLALPDPRLVLAETRAGQRNPLQNRLVSGKIGCPRPKKECV